MKILLLVCILLLTVSLNCNAQQQVQQVQQPTAAQVLQEHIRQENARTQVWADRQTEARDIREVKQRRR